MNLHVRARSVEEAWAKEVQEVAAAAHLDRLRKSGPSGAARLASAASSSAFSAGILPSIAAHYVRLDTPQKTTHNVQSPLTSFKQLNHRIAGVCDGNPLFISDMRLGSMSLRGSKWTASTGTVEGVSLFNVRGALELAQGSQSVLPVQKLPPAPPPVLKLGGLRLQVLPDLTPSRALMWGTIVAVWAVGGAAVRVSKSMGIESVADVQSRFNQALSPMAARCRQAFSPYRRIIVAPGENGGKMDELASALRVALR